MNETLIQLLDAWSYHWDRKNDREIIAWFQGYKPYEYLEFQKVCVGKVGLVLAADFDTHSGITFVTIREDKETLAKRQAS